MELKLPIGISTFKSLREEGCYYVDKTYFIKKLVDSGKYFFLSRPRRFGKSLFLDTLKQAFLARKELFTGLFIENHWDWSKRFPVIHFSFGSGVIKTSEILQKKILSLLSDIAKAYEISLEKELISDIFSELIYKLSQKFNQKVVVLIDEYDKPILDNIEKTEVAIEIREILKDFYSVLKDADPYLKFVFITGVSKFSKVSLFSGLNNLQDITLHPEYGTICGYTQKEFETVFADRLKDVDLNGVKKWYNGYCWLNEPVYNPFNILLFLSEKRFRPFWFETGTPSFLIKLLIKKNYYLPSLETIEASDEILEEFDVDRINAISLLFQTGYLTIEKEITTPFGYRIYTLRYPNLEVKSAFSRYFLDFLMPVPEQRAERTFRVLKKLFENDIVGIIKEFKSFFSSIPADWYRKSLISEYEGYYASVIYAYFSALGVETRVEDATNTGRLDMAVLLPDRCYLFEFKVVESKPQGEALRQIKERRYYEKYQARCKEIYLIGIEFSRREKNIVYFEWEKL